ncbi:MAG: DUF1592 domain-containing protein [Nannocystaceae bacterium]|nr:DUF1592 domain-containing protein [Nannocystaceae bacterium]
MRGELVKRRRQGAAARAWGAAGLSLGLAGGCYEGAAVSAAGESSGAEGTASDGAHSGDGSDGPEVPMCLEQHGEGAVLRRLTRFEYNNTVRDLLGTQSFPADGFPSEELANGFGNDADAQSVSSLLAERYNIAAEALAVEATGTPDAFARIAPCSTDLDPDDGGATDACARSFIETFGALCYRRPLADEEVEALAEFEQTLRADADFATSAAGVVEFLLQSPDFLYRVEHGFIDGQGRRRPTSHEMASRLSYFLWGTMPDSALREAAAADALISGPQVREHAERMLAAPQARAVVRFFFDNALPISGLQYLERDPDRYPRYDAQVGVAMREEVHTFLAHEVFEGPGTWDAALTAPYTFVNETLAAFYGIEGVTGDAFVRVDLDPKRRRGLLTQAGMLAGTIHSNETNPVTRGAFITKALMCTDIPFPTGDIADEVKPPDPDSGATARERFSKHSEDAACSGCHAFMDPLGLTFENFDAVGQWRDTENGVVIDASGALPGLGDVAGPLELIDGIAASESTHACFVTHWSNFAYGRTATDAHACTQRALTEQFDTSGHDIQQLLIDLTQTDDFLYLAPAEGQ